MDRGEQVYRSWECPDCRAKISKEIEEEAAFLQTQYGGFTDQED